MKNLIMFLDGKKTYIGAAFLFLGVFGTEFIKGIWGVDGEVIDNLIKSCNWIGMFVGGVGVGDKIRKGNS